jgi:RNA polymerase sigma factor (sigma-70 family)
LKRTENVVFQEFSEAEGQRRDDLRTELHKMLLAHAMSVCWLQLREYRPDVASYCVIKAFQKLDHFRGDSKFSTWFHRICLNACTSNLRNKLRQAEVPLDSVGEKGTENESAILARLELEKIREHLSGDDRVFLQWKLENLDETAIAEITGLSLSGVRAKWSRIRKRILRLLKK